MRLMHHLSSCDLLNPFQSAYVKFHSTETALLSLHDHIIKSMSLQRITGLCLLDLSAAFDILLIIPFFLNNSLLGLALTK